MVWWSICWLMNVLSSFIKHIWLSLILTWGSEAIWVLHWNRTVWLLSFEAWVCKSVSSWFAYKWEKLSVLSLNHLSHGLVQEVVCGVPWLVSILSRRWSSFIRTFFLVFIWFYKSSVANWWEIEPCWTLVHNDCIIYWLWIPWNASCKSALILFRNILNNLQWLLNTVKVIVRWLIVLSILVKLIFILIIILDINILCNILNLIDLEMVVLVIVVVSDLRIIHNCGWYLWLSIILFKTVEHSWFFDVIECWLFFNNKFSCSKSLVSFCDGFLQNWYWPLWLFGILFGILRS